MTIMHRPNTANCYIAYIDKGEAVLIPLTGNEPLLVLCGDQYCTIVLEGIHRVFYVGTMGQFNIKWDTDYSGEHPRLPQVTIDALERAFIEREWQAKK